MTCEMQYAKYQNKILATNSKSVKSMLQFKTDDVKLRLSHTETVTTILVLNEWDALRLLNTEKL